MSDHQKLGMSQVFAELEKQGDLIIIDKEVDPETEISGVIVAMEKVEGIPPLLFTKVRGYDFKVGANLFIERNRLCRILHLPQDPIEFKEKVLQAIANPIVTVLVPNGPC